MKNFFMAVIVLSLTGCASMQPQVAELQRAKVCSVWKEGQLGIRYAVEVPGEMAKQKITCWLFNSLLCSYNEYTFAGPQSSEIQSSVLGTVGKLEGKVMSAKITGSTIDPFEIQKGKAAYSIQGPIGPKRAELVEFNDKCSKRQAALGVMALLGK